MGDMRSNKRDIVPCIDFACHPLFLIYILLNKNVMNNSVTNNFLHIVVWHVQGFTSNNNNQRRTLPSSVGP